MLHKVRVKLPKAQYGNEVTANARQMSMWGGANVNKFKQPATSVRDTLQPIPREDANLEAEKGETAVVNDGSPIPAHFKIGGKRHNQGGTPLNLPENSFVFSDTRGMLIKDPALLTYFGVPTKKNKKAYTPAEIAKRFEINEYRKTLEDPNTDNLQRRTAEMMIKKNLLMLGALALAQESLKGFPQGVPVIAMPYLESKGISPEMFLPAEPTDNAQQMQEQDLMSEEGMAPQEQDFEMMEQEVNPEEMAGMQPQEMTPSPEMMMMYGGAYYNPMMMYGGNPYDYMRAGGESRTRARVTLPVFQNGAATKTTTDSELANTFSGQTVPYKLYKQLEDDVNNYSDLRAAIIAKYKEALKNKQNLGKSIDSNKLSQNDDEIIKNFLNLQKRNYATAAYYMKENKLSDDNNGFVAASKKISGTSNNPVKGGISNEDLTKVWTKLNILPTDKNTVASEQLSFIAFNDAISNVDKKKDPGLAEIIQLRGYKSAATGPQNDPGNVSGSTISIADGIATNNTTNEFGALSLQEIKDAPPTSTTPETEIVEEDDEVITPPTYYPKPAPTPFLQDVMALGRAGQNYLSITEDQPWNAYAAMTPYPIQSGRYSPEGEINALASTARTMGQAAAFGEAPSRAANLAKFQADTARGIADTLGRYNNLNVTAENQEELAKAQQMNEFQKLRGAGAQDIYDKTAIAKQQATAARQKALDNITKAGISMVTDEAKAQVLNELYPNFNIFPEAGGMMAFVPGAKGFGSDDDSDTFDWDSAVNKGKSLYPNDSDAAMRYAEGLLKSQRPYTSSSGRTSARNDIFSLFGNQG